MHHGWEFEKNMKDEKKEMQSSSNATNELDREIQLVENCIGSCLWDRNLTKRTAFYSWK